MDLCFSDGHCQAPDDSHHSNGLLERREEFDSVAFQESQIGASRSDADHSILCECPAVLGD